MNFVKFFRTIFSENISARLFRNQFLQGRSSRSQMFFKIVALKNFANFTVKHLCWSLVLMKLQTLRSAALLKRDCNTGAFLWKNTYFYRTPPMATSDKGSWPIFTSIIKRIWPINDWCSSVYRNRQTDLQCKSNEWFLHDGQHWSLMR